MTHFPALVHFGVVTWLCCYSCMFATELINGIFFLTGFLFQCYFSSFSLFIIILICTHACMHACFCFCFFFKERLVIYPSSHPFIHFSTYLPFYLIYLQDIRKMRLLLWYGENRFTGRDRYFLIQNNLFV